jgi:hypothetical protein
VLSVSVGRKNVGDARVVVSVGSQKVGGSMDCVVGSQKDAARGDADAVDRADAVLKGSPSVAIGVVSVNVFVRFQAVMFITSNVGLMMFCVVIPGNTTAPVMLMVTISIVTLSGEVTANIWMGGTVVVRVVDDSVTVNTVEGSVDVVVRGMAVARPVSRATKTLEISILIEYSTVEIYIYYGFGNSFVKRYIVDNGRRQGLK